MAEGWISPGSTFLDAGSGDGRVLLLAALIFRLTAYGVEYDDALWRRSLENISVFNQHFAEGLDPPRVLCGDFCDEKTYSRHGAAFGMFDIVFNYANDHHRLAAKVARDGARNVLFLYYGPSPVPESFPYLVPVRSLALGPPGSSARSYLHAYRKRAYLEESNL